MKKNALIIALQRLLRPLVRLLISNGVAEEAFAKLVAKVYVDVAEKDFKLAGRKQSDSRISVLTGMQRKRVAKYRHMDMAAVPEHVDVQNFGERVITAWLREPEYLDAKGDPRILPLTGEDSFYDLASRFAADIPLRAIKDELIRINNIAPCDPDSVQLLVRGYRPKPLSNESIRVFGNHSADFLATMANNLSKKDADALLFQRQVSYTEVPSRHQAEFERLSAKLGQRLLEDLDQWLAEKKATATGADEPTCRLGFGTYQITQNNEERQS